MRIGVICKCISFAGTSRFLPLFLAAGQAATRIARTSIPPTGQTLMRCPLAALFACSLVAACGGGGTPPNASIGGPAPTPATQRSMRFFGTGAGDMDRVKIPLTDVNGTSRPVNVGVDDFTLEFWINGTQADNPTPQCTGGALGRDAWASGAVVIDRDVLGDGDFGEYGVALFGGRLAFGVARGGGGRTICGTRDVLDSQWHHVAFTRQRATGAMAIFVDGAQDAFLADPGASLNVSYNPAHVNPAPNDAYLVLGAEKHDLGTALSFRGLIDELRLSIGRRYTGTGPAPTGPFVVDGNTVALYHFDEPAGTDIIDAANGNASPGVLNPAASGAASHRSTNTPF